MKNILLVALSFFAALNLSAQQFLNGDFETNYVAAGYCSYNNTNEDFNYLVPGVTAFGDAHLGDITSGGEVDVQTFNCNVDPQSGDWCLGLAGGFGDPEEGDIISVELDAPLEVGVEYTMSFWVYGNSLFTELGILDVGISNSNIDFGDFLFEVFPDDLSWKKVNIGLEPLVPGFRFITLRVDLGTDCWFQVDNFVVEEIVSDVSGITDPAHQIYPNPSTGFIQIETAEIQQVSCFDLSGKLMHQQNENSTDQVELNLNGVPSGNYLLVIQTASGVIHEYIQRL